MQEIIGLLRQYISSHFSGVLVAVISLLIGGIFIKILTLLLHRFFKKTDFDRTVEIFLERIFSIFLWVILILIIISNLGVNVTAFVAGLGVIGFIVGFATKDVFANLAAGLMIMCARPFKVGDQVHVAGIKGTIKEINMSWCIIIDDDKTYITIPNVKIWGMPIKNFSRLKKALLRSKK